MPVTPDYVAYVIDQLSPFARVVSRRMFGGIGLYANDVFFALIDDDTLYFKVDDTNRDDYIARGCEAFRPFADTASMSYYQVPSEVLEDADELAAWAHKSLRIAAAAAAAKTLRKTQAPTSQQRGSHAEREEHGVRDDNSEHAAARIVEMVALRLMTVRCAYNAAPAAHTDRSKSRSQPRLPIAQRTLSCYSIHGRRTDGGYQRRGQSRRRRRHRHSLDQFPAGERAVAAACATAS